jgi:D-alanyl-D-alanine carboxypeptidase
MTIDGTSPDSPMSLPCRFPLVGLLLALAAAPVGAAQQQPPASTRPSRAEIVARLDSIATDYLAEAPATGVTIAVVSRADTLLLKGYGERDREKHLVADANTVYRIGSITKQFTAAAVMRLVERGTVKLDDPITKYLPQYAQWSPVTVRQLLNHTSGIHSYTSTPNWRARWADDLTPAQVVSFVEKDTLDFAPGSAWRYNNTGYMLLGMLLETVTKQPYASLLDREFFQPIGMRSAAYCPSKPADAAYAIGYTKDGASFKPAPYLSMTHPYSAGALCMSVPDYLRWQSALHSGRVVGTNSVALMAGPEALTSGSKQGTKTGYGMGLATGVLGTHQIIQHGGDIHGFASQQYWFPADSLRVVAFVNTDGANQDWLVKNLASAVLGLPVTPLRPRAVPIAAADLAKFAGDYDIGLPDGRVLPFRIFVEEGELMGQAEGQGKGPLKYIGNDTFGADFDPTVRLIFTVESGRVTSAKLLQRGATMNVTRRP